MSSFLDWQKDDYYSLLGITRMATEDEIKKAFRLKAKEYHPDRFPLDSEARNRAEVQFKELTLAKDTLLDSEAREAYDQEQDLVQQSHLDAMVYDIPVTPKPPPPSFKDTLKDAFKQAQKAGSTDYIVGDDGPQVYSSVQETEQDGPKGIPDHSKKNLAQFYYSQGLRFASRGMYRRALFALNQAQMLDQEIDIPPYVMSKIRTQAYYQKR